MLKLFVIKNIILYGFNSQIDTKQLLTIIKYCVIIINKQFYVAIHIAAY